MVFLFVLGGDRIEYNLPLTKAIYPNIPQRLYLHKDKRIILILQMRRQNKNRLQTRKDAIVRWKKEMENDLWLDNKRKSKKGTGDSSVLF